MARAKARVMAKAISFIMKSFTFHRIKKMAKIARRGIKLEGIGAFMGK